MSKWLTYIAVIAIAGLMLTGVLEVRVHTDRLPAAPEALSSIGKGNGALERTRFYVVKAKRAGELFMVDNESNKMEVVIGYIEADAERMSNLMEKAESGKALVPQAELLLESIERVKKLSREVSPEVLASVNDTSQSAAILAMNSLNELQAKQQTLDASEESLTRIAESLQQEVGGFDIRLNEDASAVAGTTDNGDSSQSTLPELEQPKPSQEPQEGQTAPLRF